MYFACSGRRCKVMVDFLLQKRLFRGHISSQQIKLCIMMKQIKVNCRASVISRVLVQFLSILQKLMANVIMRLHVDQSFLHLIEPLRLHKKSELLTRNFQQETIKISSLIKNSNSQSIILGQSIVFKHAKVVNNFLWLLSNGSTLKKFNFAFKL